MGRTGIGMLAAGVALAAAGCSSGHHAAKPSNEANTPSQAPVVYATAVTSPDGKRIAVVTHNRTALEVGPASGGHRRTIYRSTPDDGGGITTDVYWASPSLIAFGDAFEVNTIDVRTRRVHTIADASSFTLYSDRRLIVWSVSGGPETPDRVGVVSMTGAECLVVPTPKNKTDTGAFFKPGVKRLFILRGPFNSPHPRSGDNRIISVALSSLRPCLP